MNIIIEGDQSNEVNSFLFVKRSSLLPPPLPPPGLALSRLLNRRKSVREKRDIYGNRQPSEKESSSLIYFALASKYDNVRYPPINRYDVQLISPRNSSRGKDICPHDANAPRGSLLEIAGRAGGSRGRGGARGARPRAADGGNGRGRTVRRNRRNNAPALCHRCDGTEMRTDPSSPAHTSKGWEGTSRTNQPERGRLRAALPGAAGRGAAFAPSRPHAERTAPAAGPDRAWPNRTAPSRTG